MKTEYLSLEIKTLPPSSVKNYSSCPSSSPQIFFSIHYDVRRKIGGEEVPAGQRDKAPPVAFHSTVESWNSDRDAACRSLLHKFDRLGIDSRHHVRFLRTIMEWIYEMVKSGFRGNVMCLEIKVINFKTYPSLKRVKDGQGGRACSICLEDIGANGASTECGHVFHCDCITEWLDKGENCPLCRKEMPSFTFVALDPKPQ